MLLLDLQSFLPLFTCSSAVCLPCLLPVRPAEVSPSQPPPNQCLGRRALQPTRRQAVALQSRMPRAGGHAGTLSLVALWQGDPQKPCPCLWPLPCGSALLHTPDTIALETKKKPKNRGMCLSGVVLRSSDGRPLSNAPESGRDGGRKRQTPGISLGFCMP